MSAADEDIAAVQALRERCWTNGWRVVAVLNWDHPDPKKAGKAPIGNNWTELAQRDPPDCLNYPPVRHALNTGVATAGLRAIDLDIDTPELARTAVALAFDMLGATIVRSRENSCRVLLVYRAALGQPGKRSLVGACHTTDHACKIEVLGKGQQYVAYGRHPSGVELQWLDGGPENIGITMVPAITEAQLDAFFEEVATLIGAEPPAKARTGKQRRPRGADGAADTDTGAAPPIGLVRLIDELADYPADLYDTWIKVGCALYHETNGSDAGLAAWDAWSAKSDRYDADVLASKWPTFGRGLNGTVVTGATIIHLARAARIARAGLGKSGTEAAKPNGAGGEASHSGPAAPAEREDTAPGQMPPRPPPPPPPPDTAPGEAPDEEPDEQPDDEPDDEPDQDTDQDHADTGEADADDGTKADDTENGGTEADDTEDQGGHAPEWIADPDEIADEDRPPITVVGSLLHRLADAAEAAIIDSRVPVYHHGILVRPAITELGAADGGKTHIAALHPLGAPDMMDLFCRTAAWRKWTGRYGFVPVDPPMMVARILLARLGQWRIPQVRGILSTPTIRRDGSLLLKSGYDPISQYYLALPPDLHVPTIRDEPEMSESIAALKLLDDLLAEFPFVDEASHSVGLSLLITALVRAAMSVVPIHGATSPTPGTGKSFLYDIAAAIIYGDRCPVIFAGKGAEELEKKLNGMLLRGTSLFNLDNLNIPLEGDLTCQVATQPLLNLRRLGKSDIFRTPNSALLGACGNNMVVHDDLNRRVVMAWMDAQVERPELRRFNADPFATVLKDRGRYIAAVLTIVRGYLADPMGVEVAPLAGFDQYTHLVREPLVWLGRADPARTMDALHAADPVVNELSSVMAAWEAAVGLNKSITAAAIINNIEQPPLPQRKDHQNLSNDQWHALLTDVRARWAEFGAALNATTEHGGKITAAALGYWLRRYSNRIANGRKFVSRSGHGGVMQWSLAG
jgi:putative DNA primase/helicase